MEHCVKCGRELIADYEHLSGICCACMAVDEEYEWEEDPQCQQQKYQQGI
jgi:hypothetical protein